MLDTGPVTLSEPFEWQECPSEREHEGRGHEGPLL